MSIATPTRRTNESSGAPSTSGAGRSGAAKCQRHQRRSPRGQSRPMPGEAHGNTLNDAPIQRSSTKTGVAMVTTEPSTAEVSAVPPNCKKHRGGNRQTCKAGWADFGAFGSSRAIHREVAATRSPTQPHPSTIRKQAQRCRRNCSQTFLQRPHTCHPTALRPSADRSSSCTGDISGGQLGSDMLEECSRERLLFGRTIGRMKDSTRMNRSLTRTAFSSVWR